MIALFFGSRYEGEVKDTIRYGKGILYSKNEDWVVGEFMNYLNGPAIYHYADGYLRAPNFSFLKTPPEFPPKAFPTWFFSYPGHHPT